MSTQFPMHPDDEQQLLHIRRYLIGFRKTNGWTQPQLSQMINATDGSVWGLESDTGWQWRFSRLQNWLIPFGLRLDARLTFDDVCTDLDVHLHPEVAPMYALSQSGDAWPRWQRIYVTSALAQARKRLNISTVELGQRLGVGYKAVGNWEAMADEVMLAKVLHHARALGGRIELGWEQADAAARLGQPDPDDA